MAMIKLILADSQAIFRAGAAKVLAVEDDVRVVAQAQTVEQMMMALEKFRATVLILSTALQPDLAPVTQLAAKVKTKLVLVVENGVDPVQYQKLGAQGVLFRSVTGPALVECVRKVAKGESWVQSAAPSKETIDSDLVGARVRDRLTAKELRIVALIVQGYKNKEIASRLGTTEQVIKNYLRNVYDKIGVSDRLELALFTIHHRILAEAAAAVASSLR